MQLCPDDSIPLDRKSLAFDVDIVQDGAALLPVFVQGIAAFASKGEPVFAPEIPNPTQLTRFEPVEQEIDSAVRVPLAIA